MEALPKPEVILTHESDLDGFLSGLLLLRLAQHLFGEDVRLEAYHYQAWKMRDLRERSAWVTDFSFDARLDKPDWVVIDHHVTDTAAKNAYLVHDVNKSAGLLCYEICRQHELASPELDRLVHLSNVADLFLEDDPDFVLAATYTVTVGLVMQAALLSLYLAIRDPQVLRAIARAWKPSMLAGFMGAFASEFWFLAFAIATAASVRTLALVEVLFAQGVTRFVFRQPTTKREFIGIVLVVIGVALLVWAY